MSKARGGGRRPVSAKKQQRRVARSSLKLAPGIRLDGGNEDGILVLVGPNGTVQLNRIAAAILRLCDGSRDRDGLVTEVLRSSHPRTRAVEIIEFLDVARARGWIDEA